MLKMKYCLLDQSDPKHFSNLFSKTRKNKRVSSSMENVFDGNVWDWVDPQNVIQNFQFLFLELQESNMYNCSQTIVSPLYY